MALSDFTPLFEYFAIIGYNPSCGLRQENITKFDDSTFAPKSPLETTYESKIIVHFPKERQGKAFAPEIALLALPTGVHLYTEQNLPHDPSFHSFVLVREDGARLYGCSLIFYEEIRSNDLRQQIFDAQLTYLHEFASSPSIASASSVLPSSERTKQTCNYTTHSLPRRLSASKEGNSFLLKTKFKNDSESVAYYKNTDSPLFISKCIAVITAIPIIYSSENFLHNLWMLINDKLPNEKLTFEEILRWALHEIPLPPPDSTIQITHPNFQMLVKRPAQHGLPFFDYPIENLFNYIPVDKFLKLFTSFMLEKQILIVSRNARTLMLIAECLSILIFPFTWQMAYCPILPHSQFKFLEAPVPWLMGLCLEDRTLPDEIAQSNICFFDVDSCLFDIPEDLPPFPWLHQITEQIQSLLRTFRDRIETDTTVHSFYQRGLQFNDAIRTIFLDHFVTLFLTYENYLLNVANNGEKPNLKGRRNARILRESTANFDKISFLVDQPESVLPFLSAFLETQMFTSFIDFKISLYQNLSSHSHIENVYIFDQKIAFNLNRKEPYSQTDVFGVLKELDTEFHITLPIPQSSRIYKYNGFIPIPDSILLESDKGFRNTSKIPNKIQKTTKTDNNVSSKELKQILIMRKSKNGNDEIDEEHNNINASLNFAHQNWKFVEQLLKETKTKTKRILVAKMGKEAIHLGHGQLHLGISGVEENTMVAAFCDLLERIWTHGLKKKQGKSALWTYIIAFHEWERKNSNIIHRSDPSELDKSTSPESHNVTTTKDNNDSPLFELISSIRKIAMDLPRFRDNSPCNTDSNTINPTPNDNNWSQSLLRAANVICEKITSTTNTSVPSNMDDTAVNRQNNQNKPKTNEATGLPPRPPALSNFEKQRRKWFTPQVRRKNTVDEYMQRKNQTSGTIDENGLNSEDLKEQNSKCYQKFIYKAPLKVLNDDERLERRGRDLNRSNRTQRSLSNQPQNNFADLASRISEDSLTQMTHSTAINETKTSNKRRTRDSSSGYSSQNYAQINRLRTGRSLSRSRGNSPSRLYERLRGSAPSEFRTFAPLPNSMAYDLKNIIRMTEIKTDIGFARAFVRLALERKQLYHYFKKLLSNTQLLQKIYKRYSFLRCDDEREQFLFHLLSLNAVDFFCFTNTFLTIKMRYQVMLIGSLDRFSDSLVYIVLTGSLGCTSSVFLPANSTQFTFDFKNLGILSTLRIGHSTKENNTQRLTKWYLDYVLVRNCITAQTFYFQCARWFGRGIEDGALERLLVAEVIAPHSFEQEEENDTKELAPTLFNSFQSPTSSAPAFLSPRKSKYEINNATFNGQNHNKWRSPSSDRKISDCEVQSSGRSSIVDGTTVLDHLQSLEHRTGVAVNALMKHFLSLLERDQQTANAKLSTLLCAEDGLLPCIDEIFTHGLIQRIFQRVYPWDYIVRVFSWFNQFFRNGESKKLTREQRSLIIYTYKMVERIGENTSVGKEERFHLFVLLSLRDHIFSGLIPLIAWTPVTSQIYDKDAFIRLPSKLSYFAKLIGSLNEFNFEYEKSLIHGMT